MSDAFEVKLNYRIKYETTQPVPIDEVISALKSLESLLNNSNQVLGEISKIDILGCQIFVEKIESGSLIEEIFIKVIFGSQQELDAFLAWLHRTNMRHILIGTLLGGALTYGLMHLTQNNAAVQNTSPANHIENSPNAMIINFPPNTVSDDMKEEVNQAIKKHTQNNSELAKQTLNFFEPIKNDSNGYVSLGGGENVANIPASTVRSIPKKYVPKKNNRFEDLNGVTIKLRATDLDSKKSGWAGAIDGITPRVKIELDPTLEPTALYGKTAVTADVTLERDFLKQKNQLVPKRIIIRAIY